MSIHKLTARSGYDLTPAGRRFGRPHTGHVGLVAYYTAKGEMPGGWVGSGMAGIDGLDAGDVVTAAQMKALYALGLHPLAAERDARSADSAPERRRDVTSAPAISPRRHYRSPRPRARHRRSHPRRTPGRTPQALRRLRLP
jgi:hypothetical protein